MVLKILILRHSLFFCLPHKIYTLNKYPGGGSVYRLPQNTTPTWPRMYRHHVYILEMGGGELCEIIRIHSYIWNTTIRCALIKLPFPYPRGRRSNFVNRVMYVMLSTAVVVGRDVMLLLFKCA